MSKKCHLLTFIPSILTGKAASDTKTKIQNKRREIKQVPVVEDYDHNVIIRTRKHNLTRQKAKCAAIEEHNHNARSSARTLNT